MHVRVLGPLQVTDDVGRDLGADDLPRRVRQILSVLAARYDKVQSKDALADAVWGDELPGNHVAALEHYVSALRRRLDPGRGTSESFIVTRPGGYLFAASRADLDLAQLRSVVRLADSTPAGSRERLDLRQRTLDLATDLPFSDDQDAEWAASARTEVRNALLAALLELGERALSGDSERALRLAADAVELDGYREQPYQIAMRACAALGRADEALRWFEQCRRLLDEELRLPPSREITEIRREIVANHTAHPELPEPPPPRALVRRASAEPIPGEAAAPRPFYGRRSEIDLVLSGDAPVVHVVGPIAAGKSALLDQLARLAPGRVGIGRVPGSGGTLRLTWLQMALEQLDPQSAALPDVARASTEGRALSQAELDRVAAVLHGPAATILAIDDAEKLDEGSVTELARLRQQVPRLCVVLTYRYPSEIAGSPVAAAEASAVLRLAPLTEEELEPVGDPRCFDLTGGIPGLVAAVPGRPELAISAAMHIARVRTRWMAPAAWEILRIAATLGPLRVEHFATLAARPVTEVLDSVDRLIHAHLIVEDVDGQVRHRSALIRDAVAEQVSGVHADHLRQGLLGLAGDPAGQRRLSVPGIANAASW